MTFGDKLAKLRRTQNYTQEQLADLLCVSRQSVSKWESDLAYPETEKIIKICELFGCSSDYLLLDAPEPNENEKSTSSQDIKISGTSLSVKERKSKKMIGGLPLWHIAKNARGIIAIGVNARGIIAVGVKSCGVVSVGVLSLGVISIGTLSLGLLFSVGLFSAALFAVGAIAAGIFSVGSISFGVFSLGAVAIGDISVGALAVGQYVAIGDHAYAPIAIAGTKAVGSTFEHVGKLTLELKEHVKVLIDETVPSLLRWAAAIVKSLLS
ncbi:MAG: helix-turn-helix transcriptional regulator [Clostridiales bacterium]|nr:helix-turn-helix transcriptional regulator [Clostridiales bacterium]